MINPYDSKNNRIAFIPKFNLPTYYGSRDNNLNVNCGLLSNMKRKLIIKQHTYRTNGVGIKPLNNYIAQIETGKNSIRIKNIVYNIPERFCKYINIIRTLAEQNIPLPDILKKLAEDFNITDTRLLTVQPSNLRNKYRYAPFNKLYKTYDNVANFSAPFKLGQPIGLADLPTLPIDLFAIRDEIRYVFVSCNDGFNYTNNIDDMKNNGVASFWGSRLAIKGNDIEIGSVIPVVVFPIDNIQNIMYGSLYTTPLNKLLYIPITTLENFPIHKNYYENMLFNIKTFECYQNVTIDYSKLRCRYIQHAKLFTNYL